MNYIIDPMWFYWINVMDSIWVISIVGIVVSVVFLIIGSIIYFENYGYDDDQDKKLGAKFIKITHCGKDYKIVEIEPISLVKYHPLKIFNQIVTDFVNEVNINLTVLKKGINNDIS